MYLLQLWIRDILKNFFWKISPGHPHFGQKWAKITRFSKYLVNTILQEWPMYITSNLAQILFTMMFIIFTKISITSLIFLKWRLIYWYSSIWRVSRDDFQSLIVDYDKNTQQKDLILVNMIATYLMSKQWKFQNHSVI